MPMAASHMLITTQTEAHQLIRETLRGNLAASRMRAAYKAWQRQFSGQQ